MAKGMIRVHVCLCCLLFRPTSGSFPQRQTIASRCFLTVSTTQITRILVPANSQPLQITTSRPFTLPSALHTSKIGRYLALKEAARVSLKDPIIRLSTVLLRINLNLFPLVTVGACSNHDPGHTWERQSTAPGSGRLTGLPWFTQKFPSAEHGFLRSIPRVWGSRTLFLAPRMCIC